MRIITQPRLRSFNFNNVHVTVTGKSGDYFIKVFDRVKVHEDEYYQIGKYSTLEKARSVFEAINNAYANGEKAFMMPNDHEV